MAKTKETAKRTATDLPDDPHRAKKKKKNDDEVYVVRELAGFRPILNAEYSAEYLNLVECEWHSGCYSSSASGTRAATRRVRVALGLPLTEAE